MTIETLTIPQEVSTSKTMRGRWPEWLTLFAYISLLAFMIPYHEPWADEAQAWQIARNVSIPDLFRTNLRYEGTPGLWPLFLAILSRLHCSYDLMHWITAAIAVFGIALLVFFAPFPRYIRLALPFTFYLAFQYAIVARSYVLVPVLLFGVALCWKRHPALIAVVLGLLGNVCLHALAISGGFALTYFMVNFRQTRSRKFALAALLLAVLYLAAILTVWPQPRDLSFLPWRFHDYSIGRKLFAFTIRALTCWTTFIPTAVLTFLFALWCWSYFAAQLKRYDLLVYGLPILTFSLFCGYYCSFWHAGLFIPTVIAICWITWPKISQLGKVPRLLVLYVIVAQLAWTVHAAVFDHQYAYSPDLAAARFLRPHVDAGEKIALTYINDGPNAYSIGLAPYFDRPIFLNQRRPFWLWTSHEHSDAEFLGYLKQRPSLVLAIYFSGDGSRFVPSRDLPHNPRADLLNQNGYRLTHFFCGEIPQGFTEREETCELIYERVP